MWPFRPVTLPPVPATPAPARVKGAPANAAAAQTLMSAAAVPITIRLCDLFLALPSGVLNLMYPVTAGRYQDGASRRSDHAE
jgi:hypothetical protein